MRGLTSTEKYGTVWLMSKAALLVVTLIVLLASAAIVGWSFFGTGPNATSQSSKQSNSATQPSQQKANQDSNKTINSPINLNNKSVSAISISYFLRGNLKEVKSLPEGLELVTDITGDGIPQFIASDKTTVVFNTDGVQSPANVSDLKPSQKLGINMFYDVKKKTWSLIKVHISVTTPAPAPQ